MHDNQLLLKKAKQFISLCYQELGKTSKDLKRRIEEVDLEIKTTGTYEHTFEELEHGAKMAWRNSNRCIGRLFWNTLHVFDERKQDTADGVFNSILNHIDYATNEGKIRPTITVFKPQQNGKDMVRIWNHQLIRYAGYETNGEIIGDSSSKTFTKVCQKLGWSGEGTAFDVLPIVIEIANRKPQLFTIPSASILEVEIEHPTITTFSDLQIKWYALPIISDMKMEIGGIHYSAAPFNGWYMGTEIGARNLADEDRYNLLPQIAEMMGLETKSNQTLWIDKALIELNIAVLDSYRKKGVSIVDHHTAAKQFQRFEKNEERLDRKLTGDWTWLIPPISPATTHIFYKPYANQIVTPNYFYQDKPYI